MGQSMLAPVTILRVIAFCVCLMFCAESGNGEGAPKMFDLISPNGGETWAGDSYHIISWQPDQSERNQVLRAQYTLDEGANWIDIPSATSSPAAGRLRWRIPNRPSTRCRVRISNQQTGASSESLSSFTIIPSQAVSGYRWENVTEKVAYAPRDGAGSLTFKDQMWLLGGWHPSDKVHFPRICNNEVWSSKDGATWNLVKPNTFLDANFDPASDWEGRHTGGYVVYDDKMWLVGGDANQGHYQNDVWNSTDGVNWTYVNEGNPVPWSDRVLHYTTVFDDKIWVMGGQAMTLPSFVPGEDDFHNDVWNTTDGVNWTQVIPQAPWAKRGLIGGSVVFQDRMWILGGGTYDTPQTRYRDYFNDVWSSVDGKNWVCHAEHAPWSPRQYHYVTVFDGRMWVLGGYKNGDRNDVWYSADGVNWYKLYATPWGPRHAASVFVYDDALWIAAGSCMTPDVWKLQRSETFGESSPVVDEPITMLAVGLKGLARRRAFIYDDNNLDGSPNPLDIFSDRTVKVDVYTHTFGLSLLDDQGRNVYAQMRIETDGDIHFDKWIDGGDGLDITVENKSNPPTITIQKSN